MTDNNQTYSSANNLPVPTEVKNKSREEINLKEILHLIKAGKKTIAATAVIFFALSACYLNFATYKYSAIIQVAATQQEKGSISGGLGGIAAMAGISLSQSGISPFSLYTRGLQSRQAAELLSHDPEIMREIFSNEWDSEHKIWVEPKTISYQVKRIVKKLLGAPNLPWSPPGAADLESYLQKNLEVEKDIEEPFATVTFHHPNPQFAQMFLQKLHTATDQYLRVRTLTRTDQYISYLNKKLSTVSVREHRDALASALSEQERQRMAASADVAYAAELVGPIALSGSPTTPQPFLVVIASIIFGTIVGLALVLIRA